MSSVEHLYGDAGPSGWLMLEDHEYRFSGWELTDGDPGTSGEIRGWFRCGDDTFVVFPGMRLTLLLRRWDLSERQLQVRITGWSTDRRWEFIGTTERCPR